MPNDRITYFECVYDLINNNAQDNSEIEYTDNNTQFGNIDTLITGSNEFNCMLPGEINFTILDGSLTEIPNNAQVSFFSSHKSNTNGEYDNPLPSITVNFDIPQNCYGITFKFAGDYPLEMNILITNDENITFRYTVYPNTNNWVFQQNIINALHIEIYFIKGVPDRYVKLERLRLGQSLVWGENEIRDAHLILENDPVADKISINTLTFNTIDKDNSYNLANDAGLHNYFQKRQVAYAYEYVNGNQLFLGKYFLDNFSWDNNLVNLSCVSYIGLLDDVQYIDGDIYKNGIKAGVLLSDIFLKASIDNYVIDNDTYNTMVYGSLEPGTCRQALREVLFACGSTVKTINDNIEIYKRDDYILDTLFRRDKINTKIIKNDYVYGVSVNYNEYNLNTDQLQEIVKNQTFSIGENTILFSGAFDNIVIKDSNENIIIPTVVKKYYCKFVLTENDDNVLTILGNPYEVQKATVQVTDDYVLSGETNTIKEYNSTLCNAIMAKEKALELLNYSKYRLTIDVQTLTDTYELDGRHWIENPNKQFNNFISWYLRRNLDLTGGFVDNATLQGYYYVDYDHKFVRETDFEMYAGEGGII